MEERGYLEGSEMATTFNMLRANDLIWSFVVNNYLLGRDPFPFDLLYWNSDSTRMPAAMHSYYLRNMYLRNRLREPGGLVLDGTPIDLTGVKTPLYFISTLEDHIAPWKSCYAGARLFKSPVHFVSGRLGAHRGHHQSPVRKQVRLLDERGDARFARRMARRGNPACRLLVGRLGEVDRRKRRRKSARAQAGSRQAAGSGGRAGFVRDDACGAHRAGQSLSSCCRRSILAAASSRGLSTEVSLGRSSVYVEDGITRETMGCPLSCTDRARSAMNMPRLPDRSI